MIHFIKIPFKHFFAVATAGFSRVSALLMLILGSRVMESAEFGLFTILFIIAGMVSSVVSGGGDMWLNKFTHYHAAIEKKGSIINLYYLRTSLLLGLFFVPIAAIFIIQNASFLGFSAKALGYAITYGIILGLNEAIFAIIRSTNRVTIFFIIRDFVCPLSLIGILLFSKLHTSESFFLFASMILMAISILGISFLLWKQKYYLPKSSKKLSSLSVYMYTVSLIANNLSSRFLLGLDSLILTSLMPVSLIGYYRLCSQFAGGFNVVQHFSYLSLPWHFHKNSAHQSGTKAISEIKLQYKVLITSAFGALMALIAFSDILLEFFGAGQANLKIPFILFLIIRFGELLWGPMHEKLISTGKITEDMLANIWGIFAWLFVFLISYIFLTPLYAAVCGTLASSLVGQYMRLLALKVNRLKIFK